MEVSGTYAPTKHFAQNVPTNRQDVVKANLDKGLAVCSFHPDVLLREKKGGRFQKSTWVANPQNGGVCPRCDVVLPPVSPSANSAECLAATREMEIEKKKKEKRASRLASPTVSIVGGLLDKKLKDPGTMLKGADQILLLNQCVQMGAQNAELVEGKDVVFAIGNTGAGKSTFINYLCGRKLVEKKRKEVLDKFGRPLKGMGKVITMEGSGSEAAGIGHELQKSATFLPGIFDDLGTLNCYCDCPGFLDNRGFEINIANAVNMRAVIAAAKSVKIVVLISFDSIKADRGRGLQDMMRILAGMFASNAVMQQHQASVLLGVTRFPLKGRDDAGDLDDLKDMIAEEGCEEVVKKLVSRMFVYDPLDRDFEEDSGLKRSALLEEVDDLPSITDACAVFQAVLLPEDELELTKICTAMGKCVHDHVQQKVWTKAVECVASLQNLSMIQLPFVDRQLEQSRLGVDVT
jgi:hypothetical protein